jgi:imidazolonepropionase-like amidohydrolase
MILKKSSINLTKIETAQRESGVVMLLGTDSGIPMKFHSQSTWHELDIWVNKLGVDPMEAIRAAVVVLCRT